MSTLKVDNIRHNSATSDAITMASDGTCTAQLASVNGGQLSHRNMIINGGMMISQKGSSVAITGGSNSYPLVDRYMAVANSSMSYNVTISHEADNPDGLGKSFKSLTTSAKTPSGSENYIIRQRLEEQNIRGVGFGTSACKKSTLTFWVKSNKTGTYSVMIYLAGFGINLLTTYTISAQNTWEKKTISIPVYTTSYTHPGDNAAGITFDWHLSSGPDDIVSPHSWQTSATNARAATGQVNILDAVNNYWQLANVQYEVGEVSTPFEYRSFADELRDCQRYFAIFPGRSGGIPFWQGYMGSSSGYCSIPVPNFNFRVVPTPTDATTGTSSSTGSIYDVYGNNLNSRFSGNGTVTLSCGGYAPSGIGLVMNFGTHQSGSKEGVVASWNGAVPGIYLDAEL